MSTTKYDRYMHTEWQRFVGNPARMRASLAAVDGVEVARVLDVGCGAGQELLPFVAESKALGVGIDLDPQVGRVGRELFASSGYPDSVIFMRATAEMLPFRAQLFDVVICRIALPYMDNRRALGEMARVLRPGGILLLKIHHARFYLHELWRTLRSLRLRAVIHDLRVLVAGTMYHIFGKQPHNRLTGGEVFQTRWLLERELKRCGLSITGEMPDSNPFTPSFIITKESGSQI